MVKSARPTLSTHRAKKSPNGPGITAAAPAQDLSSAQADILRQAAKGPKLSEALDAICQALDGVLGHCCTLTLLTPAGGSPLVAGPSISGALPADGASPGRVVAEGAGELLIEDLAQDGRFADHALHALRRGLRAVLAVPVPAQPGTALSIYAHEGRAFDTVFRLRLETLLPIVGIALAMARSTPAAGPTVMAGAIAKDSDFASLAAAIPGVVYQRVVSPEGDIRYRYISEGARDIFGVSAEEILSNPDALFSRHGEDYKRKFRERLMEASRKLETWDVEASIVTPSGEVRYTHAIARPERQDDGSVLWTGVILDATRIKHAEAAAAAAEERTREAIVESLAQGFLMFDATGKLVIRNSHFETLFPALTGLITPGMAYEDVLRIELIEGHQKLDAGSRPGLMAEFEARTAPDRPRLGVYERRLGDEHWIQVNEHRAPNGSTVVLYTDVSELKRRERDIHHLAHHDVLTGLPNRLLFRQRTEEALRRAHEHGSQIAVLCLDLDHFKSINDTLGHPTGDQLLKVVAERLTSCLRDLDTACRLGGDEFSVVISDLPSPDHAGRLARRILSLFADPVEVDGHQLVTSVSIGVALSAADMTNADHLLKSADLALYRAKADGRGTYRFFEQDMDAIAQERRALELDLRSALSRNELFLVYQPQVDAHTQELVGAEALLRWQHPTRGLVPPLDFIGIAEECGLIVQIGEWVLRRACADAVQWNEDIRVAVNLSPAQFRQRELPDVVAGILRETGLPAQRLELEITESLLLRNTEANLDTLRALKGLGIRISMDDFGTGYSSLANLRSFPFDKIKIDRSFVKDLERNADSAAIVRAMLGLGRSLGMTTTAEGVETRDQLAYLRAEGCIEVQGFFISRPIRVEDLTAMLGTQVRRGIGVSGR